MKTASFPSTPLLTNVLHMAAYILARLLAPALLKCSDGYADPSIAMNLMTGMHAPSFTPLYVALAASAAFTALAVYIFQKQEL